MRRVERRLSMRTISSDWLLQVHPKRTNAFKCMLKYLRTLRPRRCETSRKQPGCTVGTCSARFTHFCDTKLTSLWRSRGYRGELASLTKAACVAHLGLVSLTVVTSNRSLARRLGKKLRCWCGWSRSVGRLLISTRKRRHNVEKQKPNTRIASISKVAIQLGMHVNDVGMLIL